jgi:hypothetical protein
VGHGLAMRVGDSDILTEIPSPPPLLPFAPFRGERPKHEIRTPSPNAVGTKTRASFVGEALGIGDEGDDEEAGGQDV